MTKKHLLILTAILFPVVVALTTSYMASAENKSDIVVTADAEEASVLEQAEVSTSKVDMQFDSVVELVTPNKATTAIELLQGDSELSDCSIVFSITFNGEEYPCEIRTPSGQVFTSASVDAYNTSEITGLGIIAYYRINDVELGIYTITSTSDSDIFNCAVDVGLTNVADFAIDESGSMDDTRSGNILSQDEYDTLVEDVVQEELSEESASDEDVIRQSGVNLEGQTGDVDASTDSSVVDSVEEYNAKLQSELEELQEHESEPLKIETE